MVHSNTGLVRIHSFVSILVRHSLLRYVYRVLVYHFHCVLLIRAPGSAVFRHFYIGPRVMPEHVEAEIIH